MGMSMDISSHVSDRLGSALASIDKNNWSCYTRVYSDVFNLTNYGLRTPMAGLEAMSFLTVASLYLW